MKHGAYILVRYSTENQSEASIEVQVGRCTEWCNQQSIPVLDVFADRAISGMKETRPEYQRMMQALYAGGADTVVIYDPSRMFRNMVYWFQFWRTTSLRTSYRSQRRFLCHRSFTPSLLV